MISESTILNTKSLKKNGSSLQKRETFAAWFFCALPLFFLLLFLVTPFIIAFVISFTDQRLISNPNLPTQFIALRNFLRLFSINICHLISPPFLPSNKPFVLMKQPAQLEKIALQWLKHNQLEAF